ncbi:MAG: dihydroorotate dehydrogenase electron transfer subunit [Planctomycetaceae bacterium]
MTPTDCSQNDSCENQLPGMVPHALQCDGEVISVRRLATETWAVKIRVPSLARRITPGQFFMVRPPHGTDPLLGRPFALFDIFEDENGNADGVEFGFVRVGKMTSLMSQWQPGDSVQIWGPLGNGFPLPACRHLVMVAGGIGQTPFLGVAREALGLATYGDESRQLRQKPESVTLCYGVRSEEYLAGLEEFRLPGLSTLISTDDGSHGHHGFVTDLLREQLAVRFRSLRQMWRRTSMFIAAGPNR